MEIRGTIIEDTFAEAFRMWAARLVVTAIDRDWVRTAVQEVCGYGTSVIDCDAEAGQELELDGAETPDGRPGAAILFFAFNAEKLGKAVANRAGQCLMTCPTTAVYDGLTGVTAGEDSARLDLGKRLRFFGDGHQKSKVLAGRRYWRVPVMDGEFVVEETCGAVKAIGGGNFLICGSDQRTTLAAARRAVEAIAAVPDTITPFPGGVVRSGSKVGSRYKALFASSNDAFCPTLRASTKTSLREGVGCVYEIVINGLTKQAIENATRLGIHEAAGEGIVAISAGNYGGNLGKFHFKLHEIQRGGGAMSGYTLTWKDGAGASLCPGDGSFLRPDTLGLLKPAELAALPVQVGRTKVALGELFEIRGEPPASSPSSESAPPLEPEGLSVLQLEGLPAWDRLGAGMTSGELIVDGDVGHDLGASMTGGRIHVHGRAGHRVGGPDYTSGRGMTGGEIVIDGDAGDYAGLRMRRGLIAIRGHAGASPGFRMIAGTVVVGHGPLNAPGLEMRRGTVLGLGRDVGQGAPLPYLEAVGAFDAAVTPFLNLLIRRLTELGWAIDPAAHTGQYRLAVGDRFELGKGEVWQWVN